MALPREKTIEQAVTPRRRQATTGNHSRVSLQNLSALWPQVQRWLHIGVYVIGIPMLAWGLYTAAHSKAFALASVEIAGQERLSSHNIERTIRHSVSGNLLTASLPDVQHTLESLTWVKHAQVTRILPNTLRVRIEERKPLVLARLEGQDALVWLDDEGVVLGGYEVPKDRELPPIAVGFTPDRSEKGSQENQERIEVYKKLMWALDSGNPQYSQKLECIDLTHPEDVSVQLSGSKVLVQLGGEEYRGRLVRALEVLDVIHRRDTGGLARLQISDPRILQFADRITSVSVVNPIQVSLGFGSMEKVPALPTKTTTTKTPEKKPVPSKPPEKDKQKRKK